MKAHGLVYAVVAVTLVVSGQTLLKAGMTRVGAIGVERLRRPVGLVADALRVWQVWAGLGLYVCSAAVWILALSTVPLSVAYPFLALSYVGIAGISVAVLGEWLTPAQWIGILSVVGGVALVALAG